MPTKHTVTLSPAATSLASDRSIPDSKAKKPVVSVDESESDGREETDDVSDHGEQEGRRRMSRSQRSPTITTDLPPADVHSQGSSSSPMSPTSRAWYEFDLAVVVALVSPIGNWLTGGDYIKNIFLVILLIFYLHQIIEVPWELYHKSRPRKRPHNAPPQHQQQQQLTAEDKYRHVATSELRSLELLFLAISTISPLLGALFLRYVTATVLGHDSVSWFSTSLFVLATGMRPWSHVVERFRQRATDLHDVVHYPSPRLASQEEDQGARIAELVKRVEHLDRTLTKMKTRFGDWTEEVFDYVDEAVAAVDRTVKKNEKRYEKQESKVGELELSLEGLKNRRSGSGKAGLAIRTTEPSSSSSSSLLARILPSWFFSKPSSSPQSLYHSSSPSKHSLRSFPSSSSNTTAHLDTIPEEEVASASTSAATGIYSVFSQFKLLVSFVLSRIGYVATMPLRAVIRMVLQRY